MNDLPDHARSDGDKDRIVQDALRTVRDHLGMEIAYLSEFVGEDSVFRAVDAPGLDHLIKPGDKRPLSEVYCKKIIDGTLPELMPNTADFPKAAEMPITRAAPIGAHVSIPIRRSDGSTYGMFCCLSPKPSPGLNARDLSVMRIFGELVQREIQRDIDTRMGCQSIKAQLSKMIEDQTFKIVYQPIHRLADSSVSGFEALCRFQDTPYRPPDSWFSDADSVGFGPKLELCVLEAALEGISRLPPPYNLSVNAGPDLILTGCLPSVFARFDPTRLMLEVTEHVQITDHEALNFRLDELRDIGVLIAVDDAGAGYSGLQELVRLKPELIKLDRSLVTHVETDAARRALCAAFVHYSEETDSILVAEGIERAEEANVLRSLGVHRGQGWFFSKPMTLDEAITFAVTQDGSSGKTG